MLRVLAALLTVLSASAAAEQRWLRAVSPHFELYTTGGEKRAREAVLYFEQVRNLFLDILGAPASKAPVRIVAFNSAKEYEPYRMGPGAPAFAGGGPGRDEIVMESISEGSYPLAVHEYVHLLLKPFPKVPLWLNEGQAELYSTLRPGGGKVSVGEIPEGRYLVLRSNKWIGLETLFAVDRDSPYYNKEGTRQQIFYAESWALAHMLFLSGGYRPKSAPFLHLVEAGATEAEAFERAFGKTTAQVWADLQAYMDGGRIRSAAFTVPIEKPVGEPEIRMAPPLESGLVLAAVLVDAQRLTEATQAYAQLAREYPASPEIPEALAYLAYQSKREEEARAEFAKAAELGSKNAHMYYDYASLLYAAGAPPEKQVPLLRRAVALDPDLSDARYDLALLLIAGEDFEGALAQFAAIRQVQPSEAFRFFHALAYACYGAGDEEGARANAKRAEQYAKEPGARASLQALLASLDSPPHPTGGRKTLLQRPYSTFEGALDQVDCHPNEVRILLTGGRDSLWLLVNDPQAIGTLQCGPQKARRVRVEYVPAWNRELGTVGLVHSIEFQ
jgi:tetratricopeptide (TPR) repeat protein